MQIRSVAVSVCVVLLVALAGCPGPSSRPEVELVPVDGTVTMDGQPLAGASVMFGRAPPWVKPTRTAITSLPEETRKAVRSATFEWWSRSG
jgi:hypothetical protein